MAKVKLTVIPNKIQHIRVSYLYQAASYLATAQHSAQNATPDAATKPSNSMTSPEAQLPASRRLVSDLRSISLKAQLRMSPEMKHSMCKNCHSLLIAGSTCLDEVENRSKGGKKPWADVLVRKCNTCGAEKRYPVAARQKRRPHRVPQKPIQSRGQ